MCITYLTGISVREKVTVDLFELLNGEMSAWTVFEKAFIPLLNFGVYKNDNTTIEQLTNDSNQYFLFGTHTGEFRILFQIL